MRCGSWILHVAYHLPLVRLFNPFIHGEPLGDHNTRAFQEIHTRQRHHCAREPRCEPAASASSKPWHARHRLHLPSLCACCCCSCCPDLPYNLTTPAALRRFRERYTIVSQQPAPSARGFWRFSFYPILNKALFCPPAAICHILDPLPSLQPSIGRPPTRDCTQPHHLGGEPTTPLPANHRASSHASTLVCPWS